VHGSGFEEVAAEFVEVGDRAEEVGCDVALVVKGLEAAPDA